MKILIIILLAILFVLLMVFLESIRELNSLRVTSYEIDLSKKMDSLRNDKRNDERKDKRNDNINDKNVSYDDLKNRKIVFLSDYHEASCLNKKIIHEISVLKPDLILVGGDMVNGKSEEEDTSPASDLLNSISKIAPVLYALGNHDDNMKSNFYDTSDLWSEYVSQLNSGIKLLENESVSFFDGELTVHGLDIPLNYYKRVKFPKLTSEDINERLSLSDEKSYNILLGHAPDFIDGYLDWGADLALSGHFHGGMVRLPLLGGVISPRLKLFPKYTYGKYIKTYNGCERAMIVTNGLGQHTLKIRINNIPEIVVISFKC